MNKYTDLDMISPSLTLFMVSAVQYFEVTPVAVDHDYAHSMNSPSEPLAADESILGKLPIPILHRILHGYQRTDTNSMHGVRLSCRLLQREHDASARNITLREDHLLHGTAGLCIMPREPLLEVLRRLGSVESLTLIRGKGRIFKHDGADSPGNTGFGGLVAAMGALQEAGAVLRSIESDIPLTASDLKFIRDCFGWTSLQKLCIVESGGGSYAPGIPLMVIQCLNGLIRLQHLCLKGIPLAPEGARCLAELMNSRQICLTWTWEGATWGQMGPLPCAPLCLISPG